MAGHLQVLGKYMGLIFTSSRVIIVSDGGHERDAKAWDARAKTGRDTARETGLCQLWHSFLL